MLFVDQFFEMRFILAISEAIFWMLIAFRPYFFVYLYKDVRASVFIHTYIAIKQKIKIFSLRFAPRISNFGVNESFF